jgi:hypothetical protein
LRPKEKKKGDDPQPDGDTAVRCNRRHNIEIENGDHKQEHQIASPEGTDEVGLHVGLWRGGQKSVVSRQSSVIRSAAFH